MKYYLLYKFIEKDGYPFIKYDKLISTKHNIRPEDFPGYKIDIVDINCNSLLINFYGDEKAEYALDTLYEMATAKGLSEEFTPKFLFVNVVWPCYTQYQTKHEMTLDEAIKHCEEKATTVDCIECALEHKQLAEWLKELKAIKNICKENP